MKNGWWILACSWLAGCGGTWACVSDEWVVDADGQRIDVCVEAASRGLCEEVVGSAIYGDSCADRYVTPLEDCDNLTLTPKGEQQLADLGVVTEDAGVLGCDAGYTTTP